MTLHWFAVAWERQDIWAALTLSVQNLTNALREQFYSTDYLAEDVTRRTYKTGVTWSLGIGGEIAALISEQAFEWLDAPIRRLGGLDVPIPFSPPLEDAYRPSAAKIVALGQELAAF
ncbi:MAG: hypothetical protein HC802_08020 [Caldilineaceae bacterium]|nr:hypothetical protein [Caldilineaceae bacterium]